MPFFPSWAGPPVAEPSRLVGAAERVTRRVLLQGEREKGQELGTRGESPAPWPWDVWGVSSMPATPGTQGPALPCEAQGSRRALRFGFVIQDSRNQMMMMMMMISLSQFAHGNIGITVPSLAQLLPRNPTPTHRWQMLNICSWQMLNIRTSNLLLIFLGNVNVWQLAPVLKARRLGVQPGGGPAQTALLPSAGQRSYRSRESFSLEKPSKTMESNVNPALPSPRPNRLSPAPQGTQAGLKGAH